MTYKTVLFGIAAIGAVVLAGPALAQGVGAAGKVVAPVPAIPVTPAIPATPPVPATPVPSAATTGADASATTTASIPAGTVVRSSTGAELGVVMAPDPAITSAGRVTLKTSTGLMTVPLSSLRMEGDAVISTQAEPTSPQ